MPLFSWTSERLVGIVRLGRKDRPPCQGDRTSRSRTRRSSGVRRSGCIAAAAARSSRSPTSSASARSRFVSGCVRTSSIGVSATAGRPRISLTSCVSLRRQVRELEVAGIGQLADVEANHGVVQVEFTRQLGARHCGVDEQPQDPQPHRVRERSELSPRNLQRHVWEYAEASGRRQCRHGAAGASRQCEAWTPMTV